MITGISVAEAGTYRGAAVMIAPLKRVNYFFGGNGSGKTTISRVIGAPLDHPTCALMWEGGTELRRLVYNEDYLRANFVDDGSLPGIFTLGADNADVLKGIVDAKTELEAIATRIERIGRTLNGPGGLKSQLQDRYLAFEATCWKLKKAHDASFKAAFAGFALKKTFTTRIIDESKRVRRPGATPKPLAELSERAKDLFGTRPEKEPLLAGIDGSTLATVQRASIWSKRVVGKDDVDLARLIKKLQNGDWVRRGRPYAAESDGLCPFCQQDLPETLEQQLNEFFDEQYVTDVEEIKRQANTHDAATGVLLRAVDSLAEMSHRYLDSSRTKLACAELKQRLVANAQLANRKRNEPSRAVTFEDIDEALTAIRGLVDQANNAVRQQHQRVSNFDSERRELVDDVWWFLCLEVESETTTYRTKAKGVHDLIAGKDLELAGEAKAQATKERELRGLEAKVTSTRPTAAKINGLLQTYGFHSFSLEPTADERGYRLVRPDGTSEATKTLSEGERTFIAFLYFYHLALGGHHAASGINDGRIVVLDDPVSSLDSDVLFVVSALIRTIAVAAREQTGPVKQLFVLTHNAYFHKEVTYSKLQEANTTFWTVRKVNKRSTVEGHGKNPVMTTYERLWDELKRARDGGESTPGIRNVMRRVLEHYFKLLGHVDLHELPASFEGAEQAICLSLVKWTHDGSHAFFDDPSYTPSSEGIGRQLEVFRKIFVKQEQLAHYNMMMGE